MVMTSRQEDTVSRQEIVCHITPINNSFSLLHFFKVFVDVEQIIYNMLNSELQRCCWLDHIERRLNLLIKLKQNVKLFLLDTECRCWFIKATIGMDEKQPDN